MKCIKYIGFGESFYEPGDIVRVPDCHARQWVKKGSWKYASKEEWKKARTPLKE